MKKLIENSLFVFTLLLLFLHLLPTPPSILFLPFLLPASSSSVSFLFPSSSSTAFNLPSSCHSLVPFLPLPPISFPGLPLFCKIESKSDREEQDRRTGQREEDKETGECREELDNKEEAKEKLNDEKMHRLKKWQEEWT